MSAKTRTQRLETRHAKKARGEAIDAALEQLFAARDQADAARELHDVAETALSTAVMMPK